MGKQIKMEAVSFRLPKRALAQLKRHSEHTKWVQSVVLLHLGLCPLCGHEFAFKPKNAIEKMVGHDDSSAA